MLLWRIDFAFYHVFTDWETCLFKKWSCVWKLCFFLNLCHRGYSAQNTLIQISSFRAATTPRVWDPNVPCRPDRRKTKQSKNNGDHAQASNSERTEVRWRFSELLSDGSQNCFKTPEITNTNLTIWNDHTCRWRQIRWICSCENLPMNANLSDTV